MRQPMLTHFLIGGNFMKKLLILWLMLTIFLFSCSAEGEVEPKIENITEDTYSVWEDDDDKAEETYEEEDEWKDGYIGSVNSDVYHYPDCKWVKEIYDENRIEFDTEEDAKSKGYRGCHTCNP